MSDCVFCNRVAAKEYHATPTLHVVAFEPLEPVVPGHMLFIPTSHVANAATNPRITSQVMLAASYHAAEQNQPFNLITSSGREATQSVFHLHVHYVPRETDDHLLLPWSTQHGWTRQVERTAEYGSPGNSPARERDIIASPWRDIPTPWLDDGH